MFGMHSMVEHSWDRVEYEDADDGDSFWTDDDESRTKRHLSDIWNETSTTDSTMLMTMMLTNRSAQTIDDTVLTAAVYGYISPIVILLTVITNTFVCIVLLQRNMRSPTNLLLVAMAIADSLTGAIPAPSFVYFYTLGAYRNRFVPYGWCQANNALLVTLPTICHTASIWLTVALSVQRYVYVCHPVEAKRLCTLRGAAKAVAAICVVATLTQSTPLIEWSYAPIEVTLPVDNDNDTVSGTSLDGGGGVTMYGCYRIMTEFVAAHKEIYFSAYWWFRVVFIHLIPCTSLVFLNARLFLAMRAAQSHLLCWQTNIENTSFAIYVLMFLAQIRRDLLLRQNRRSESRRLAESNLATLMLLAVVGVFLLVEFPLAVLLITLIVENTFDVQTMAEEDRHIASLFINLCILLSYPVNFFIYCTMSRQFRDTFRRLFCRQSQPPQPHPQMALSTANGTVMAVEMTAIDGVSAWQRP